MIKANLKTTNLKIQPPIKNHQIKINSNPLKITIKLQNKKLNKERKKRLKKIYELYKYSFVILVFEQSFNIL